MEGSSTYSWFDYHIAYQRHIYYMRLQTIIDMAPFLSHPPPTIKSQSTHTLFLQHLLRAGIDHPEILVRNPLFVFYETLYPHSERSSVINYPRPWPHHFNDRYTYPPAFSKLLEDCLAFYCNHLDALLPKRPLDALSEPEVDPREGYLNILRGLGKTSGESALDLSGDRVHLYLHRTAIAQRWTRGLLREGQIRLLEIVVRMLLDQLSAIIKADSDKAQSISGDSVPVVDELSRLIYRCRHSIAHFFGSKRFRSERLEVLLLKYLAEEGVSMEVVRGLEIAQRAFEDTS